MSLGQIGIALAHVVAGWGLCGATMVVGLSKTSEHRAQVIHAVAVPVIFGVLSAVYFTYFAYTEPLTTALASVALVVLLDFFVVALLIQRDLSMFKSMLGTWIPFALIFLSVYFVGRFLAPARASGLALTG